MFTYTSNNKKVDFHGKTQKCSNISTTCIIHRELVRNNKQPSDSRHSERLSNTIPRVRTFSSITSSITLYVSGGDTVIWDTGVVKDGCNKTEHLMSKSISEFNFSHCVKNFLIWSYSALHFPTFGLNTERYSISLYIHSKCGKMKIRITPIRTLFMQWEKLNSNIDFDIGCSVLLHSSKCGKMQNRITPNTNTFYDVSSSQGCRSPSRNKFESIISAYSACTFRNGRIVPSEKALH